MFSRFPSRSLNIVWLVLFVFEYERTQNEVGEKNQDINHSVSQSINRDDCKYF